MDWPTSQRVIVAMAVVTAVFWATWTAPDGSAEAVAAVSQSLRGYEIVTGATELSSYGVQSTSARCSPGKKVLGGGASIVGASGVAVFWNGPARTGGSWAAAAHEIKALASGWSLEVYAICAYTRDPR